MRIVERHGYDIAPIDATNSEGELTLLSYVWPDMTVRMDRLRGAISVARHVPARLQRSTAAEAVAGLTVADGALTVLWHSITWQYLSADEQAAARAGIDAVAAHARTPLRLPTSCSSRNAAPPAPRTPSCCEFAAGRAATTGSWPNARRTARQ